MTDGKTLEDLFKKLEVMLELEALRRELLRRVLSELSATNTKWATKFANTVLEDKSYNEKEVQDGAAITDLFTKTYLANVETFEKPTDPYELWKVGEVFFTRKDNDKDMRKISDILLSQSEIPSTVYIVTVSEGTLVAEKVNTHKFICDHGELDRPIPTIVMKKKEQTTAKQVEEFRAEQPYMTHRPVEGETFGHTGYYNYAEAIRNLNAIATGVESDSLAKSIVATENAREIFCHITGQPFTTFTKLSTDVIVIDRSDLPSKVKVLVEHLSNIFELSKINVDPLLLSYSLYQYYDKPDNNYIDILNTIHTIVEAANDLQKKDDLK